MPSLEKTSPSKPFLLAAVDDVDARDAVLAGPDGVRQLRHGLPGGSSPRCFFRNASASSTVICRTTPFGAADAALGGQVDELHGPQRLGHLDRDRVGVEAVRVALAVDAERRHDRDDVVFEQRLQQPHVDALDPAGELVIDAAEDAGRVGDDGVRAGAAQVVGRQPFEDFVRDAVGGGDGDLQRVAVGDARCRRCRTASTFSELGEPRIWWAAPWTSATPMLRLRSRAMSSSRLGKLSSSTTAPSRAMTNTRSRNRGT